MQLSAIDANLLVILDPLLRTQSVSKAAQFLGLSASATSHALARLRGLFGDELLVRAGRGLVLTHRGAALAPVVAQAVAALQRVVQPADDFQPRALRRTFHLLYATYHDWVWLPALDQALRSQAPAVNVHTHSATRPGIERLRDGSIDLAFVVGAPLPSDMYCRSVFSDRFVSIVRVGHPCLAQPMTLERYAAMDHILVSPLGGPTGVVDTMLAEHGLERRVARTFTNFMAAPYLVTQSDYVLTLPQSVARLAATLLDFEHIDVPIRPPDTELRLAWHQRTHHDPANRWFRELVVQVMTQGLDS